MKKIFWIVLLLSSLGMTGYCQYLTQSADGKGTFLFKGTNVSLDIGKTDFSFTMNNLNNPVKKADAKDNHLLFFGGSMSAKSEEGIGNLFSKGDFVPSANLNGYFGVRFSNSYDNLYKEKIDNLSDNLQSLSISQINAFIINMNYRIDENIQASPLENKSIIQKISGDWKAEVAKGKVNELTTYLKTYLSNNNFGENNSIVSNIITELLKEIKELKKTDEIQIQKITAELNKYWNGFIRNRLWRFSIFTFGGIQGSSFKRVDSINMANLSKTFIKENYRGGNWGVGVNYQVNSWKFGVTYSYTNSNNFASLDKNDYKLTTSYNSSNQELTREKTITAYSGKYAEVEMNQLNSDVLYTFGLGSEDGTYAMLNAYYRGNFFSRNKNLIPNNFDIGLGTYFFGKNSKFLGGLYVELQDVDNAFEKNKPVADQNIQPALKRLTFGIIGKFSLNSLISWQ